MATEDEEIRATAIQSAMDLSEKCKLMVDTYNKLAEDPSVFVAISDDEKKLIFTRTASLYSVLSRTMVTLLETVLDTHEQAVTNAEDHKQ